MLEILREKEIICLSPSESKVDIFKLKYIIFPRAAGVVEKAKRGSFVVVSFYFQKLFLERFLTKVLKVQNPLQAGLVQRKTFVSNKTSTERKYLFKFVPIDLLPLIVTQIRKEERFTLLSHWVNDATLQYQETSKILLSTGTDSDFGEENFHISFGNCFNSKKKGEDILFYLNIKVTCTDDSLIPKILSYLDKMVSEVLVKYPQVQKSKESVCRFFTCPKCAVKRGLVSLIDLRQVEEQFLKGSVFFGCPACGSNLLIHQVAPEIPVSNIPSCPPIFNIQAVDRGSSH